MGEIFPSHVRSSAASVATMLNWTCSFVVTLIFSPAAAAIGPANVFLVFAVVCAAGFAFSTPSRPPDSLFVSSVFAHLTTVRTCLSLRWQSSQCSPRLAAFPWTRSRCSFAAAAAHLRKPPRPMSSEVLRRLSALHRLRYTVLSIFEIERARGRVHVRRSNGAASCTGVYLRAAQGRGGHMCVERAVCRVPSPEAISTPISIMLYGGTAYDMAYLYAYCKAYGYGP